jgi:hypothetical protein
MATMLPTHSVTPSTAPGSPDAPRTRALSEADLAQVSAAGGGIRVDSGGANN